MKIIFVLIIFWTSSFNFIFCQKINFITKKLDEVIIESSRIDLPFSKNSRSIQIISQSEIQKSGASNLVSLLQQISGIDIRQRGIFGLQADLYIRGGSFDQTLLLIDGIKLEDAQTGHHTLNLLLPIELVERVEIIKGSAARIFGQNAFTGAINIVTKDLSRANNRIEVQSGSYNLKGYRTSILKSFTKTKFMGHFSYNRSKGYRYNSDFSNKNYFIKSNLKMEKIPIKLLAFFSDKKFGANGFYASPSAKDQYEETQGSVIAFSSEIKKEKSIIKPKIYWRRNQDMYVYIRDNPSIYRNLHIGNKVGTALDLSLFSKIGTTGLGIDVSKVFLRSNNLGNHQRVMTNIFIEHMFLLFKSKLDLTIGIAFNKYSDFGNHYFPGLDIGYNLSNSFKLYGNIGSTYRIPTYTDLYYSDKTTLGNKNLNPESAFNFELGLRYFKDKFKLSSSVFVRKSKNLIDYVKTVQNDLWMANNILKLDTEGYEIELVGIKNLKKVTHTFKIGYTYINDNNLSSNFKFSKYSINSFKHHFVSKIISQWTSFISSNIVFKSAKRTSDKNYKVVDASIQFKRSNWKCSLFINNIFNETYSETNLVPMPKSNGGVSLEYIF